MAHPFREILRFAPARPAFAAGLRAGAAATLPLIAGPFLPLELLSWVSLGGFLTTLVDKGGAYRTRATAMAAVALFGALGCFLGALTGDTLAIALPLTLLWLLAGGLGQAGGAATAGAGNVVGVIFVVAVAQPAPTAAEALAGSLAVLAGATWAMALGLLLWPVRLYKPARLALARCYDGLSTLAELLLHAAAARDEVSAEQLHQARARVRGALEEARGILAATRRGRQGESRRGERLLVLLENGDQLLGACIAVDGWLESAGATEREGMGAELEALRRNAVAIAALLRNQKSGTALVEPPTWQRGPDAASALQRRLLRHLQGAIEGAQGLRDGRPVGELAGRAPRLEVPRRRVVEVLRESLDRRSVVLRHALRRALAGTAATALVATLELEHGYWLTVTAIATLQPWTTATFRRGVQRMVGTTLGAGIAVAAVALVDDRLAFVAIVFVLCSASVALLPLNYGVFSVFLTPAFVLLAELGTGDFSLAWVRVADTLAGGAIALVASRLLWPAWERQRFPDQLAITLRGSAGWIRKMAAGDPGAEVERRQVGIAILNTEASLQRLLSEAWRRVDELEPLLALTLYLRRLHGTSLALFSDRELPPAIRLEAGEHAAAMLEQMAAAVASGRPPPAADDRGEGDLPGAQADPRVHRLLRQLAIVRDAARRGFAGGAFRRRGRGQRAHRLPG